MEFVSVKEYAKRIGLGEAFIRSLVLQGQIPSIMVGVRKRKINVEEADKTIKAILKRKETIVTTSVHLSFKERLAEIKHGVR